MSRRKGHFLFLMALLSLSRLECGIWRAHLSVFGCGFWFDGGQGVCTGFLTGDLFLVVCRPAETSFVNAA